MCALSYALPADRLHLSGIKIRAMKTDQTNHARRRMIRNLMLGTLSLWVDWRPSKEFGVVLAREAEHEDKTIRAFIETVVPGYDITHPDLTTIFRDPFFGFEKVRWIFNFNLRKRALSQHGSFAFHKLNVAQRAEVIQSGLQSEKKISQLYSAAIFATQLTVFTGFYMKRPTCPIIDFEEGFSHGEISYSDGHKFFQKRITSDGNYH